MPSPVTDQEVKMAPMGEVAPETPVSANNDAFIDDELIVLLESLEKQLDESKKREGELEAANEELTSAKNSLETSFDAQQKALKQAKLKQAEAEAEVLTFITESMAVSAAETTTVLFFSVVGGSDVALRIFSTLV